MDSGLTVDTALTELSIADAAALLDRRELSSAELTQAYLRQIATTEPVLNAYVTVTEKAAMRSAERADALRASGSTAGLLCGIPLGLKDLYDVRDVATTAGSALLRHNVAVADSTVAACLRLRGAVLLGKQSTHEFAWGGTTNNVHFGPTRNPHDHTRIPGGSSGGSAASLVAGSCAGAFGTDTCGSVRIPAALSGCVGLKPTYGRISLHRVVPLAWSLDHAGPLARTVRDVALLYTAVTGFDPADARTLPMDAPPVLDDVDRGASGLRVGRLRGWYEEILDAEVRAAVDSAAAALRDAGCAVTDIRPVRDAAPTEEMFTLVASEAIAWHWATFGRRADGYSSTLAALLAAGPPTSEATAAARESVGAEAAGMVRALQDVDALLSATVPAPAPTVGAGRVVVDGHEMHVERMLIRLTSVFNAARLPALSVPFGRNHSGLPVGVQLIGRHLDEASVLRVGEALERARG
jgi:aspartyl-tRNA(Asn)/glutamyl-tRNA(Gln) amidotransferase subunit A